MKKKVFSVLIALVLGTSLLLAACAAPAPAPAPTPTPAPAPIPAAPPEVITWKAQSNAPTGDPSYEALASLCDRVAAASGGRLVIKGNPGGAIVPGTKEFDGVNDGVLDFAHTMFAYWKDKFPTAGLISFTIGGLSPMEAVIWYISAGGKELADRMIAGYNVKLIPVSVIPPELFLSCTKPLETLDDIKGLKIRTAGDDGEIFSRMGAAVVGMPPGEVYEAMQRGVLDGYQLGTPGTDWALGMQEVSDYVYLSGVRQPCQLDTFLVCPDSWAELPDDLKQLLKDECMAGCLSHYAWRLANDNEGVQNFIDYGTNIGPASEEIVAEMVRQADIFYDEEAAKDPFFAEVLNSIREFKNTYLAAWERL